VEGLLVSGDATGVLAALEPFAGSYEGQGINHEGEPFTGRLQLQAVVDGRGLQVCSPARSPPTRRPSSRPGRSPSRAGGPRS